MMEAAAVPAHRRRAQLQQHPGVAAGGAGRRPVPKYGSMETVLPEQSFRTFAVSPDRQVLARFQGRSDLRDGQEADHVPDDGAGRDARGGLGARGLRDAARPDRAGGRAALLGHAGAGGHPALPRGAGPAAGCCLPGFGGRGRRAGQRHPGAGPGPAARRGGLMGPRGEAAGQRERGRAGRAPAPASATRCGARLSCRAVWARACEGHW